MPQRHSRMVDGRRHVWLTEELWKLAADLPPFDLPVEDVVELDWNCWFDDDDPPTIRAVAEHARRIQDASLEHPIVLNADGQLMDGGHRLAKALLLGHATIRAVRFEATPPPHEVLDPS
ncbi:MAG: hypothetical protein AAF533_07275 [Acidobacteriota bacterium]